MRMLEGLPFAYDEDDFAEALLNSTVAHPAIMYRIDTLGGGSGGWPEVTFFAPSQDTLDAFVRDVYASGDTSQDDYLLAQSRDVTTFEQQRGL